MPDSTRASCPIAASLDLIGDRWTLVVMRDMLLGGRHGFSEIGADEGIATNILADRLERLVGAGVIERREDPDDGRRRIYVPTESGFALIPVLLELVVWGSAHTEAKVLSDMAATIQQDRAGLASALEVRARKSRRVALGEDV